ncbi:MAG: hypothetical protein VCA55_10410, partial [Verrucomicrobiales bacterium]
PAPGTTPAPVSPPVPEPAPGTTPAPAPAPQRAPESDGCKGEENPNPAPETTPAAPPAVEPAPETTPAAPPAAEPAPETTPTAPPAAEPVAETTPAAPPAAEPAPETTPAAPPAAEPAPETTPAAPPAAEPVPETTPAAPPAAEPVPETTPAAPPAAEPAPETTPLPPPTPVLTEEEKATLNEEYFAFITGFLEKSRAENADFAAVAREYTEKSKATKTEVIYQKLDSFSQLDPPEDLQDKDQVVRRIFAELSNSKQIITPNDDSGHWIVHLIGIEEPQPLTLDQAREQIKEALTGTLALESIDEKLKSAREKLTGSTKDGATFKAAAEALDFTVERIAYARTPPVNPKINSAKLRDTVNDTVAGRISEPQHDSEKGGMLIYVAEKSVKDEGAAAQMNKKDNIARSLKSGGLFSPSYKLWLFRSWLKQARKDANPLPVVLPQNIFGN